MSKDRSLTPPLTGGTSETSPDLAKAVRTALGLVDGYVLDWRVTGCQLTSSRYRALLTCGHRESRWRCEVIGPHVEHRWSEHLMVHERLGNGYGCQVIGDRTLASLYGPLADQGAVVRTWGRVS